MIKINRRNALILGAGFLSGCASSSSEEEKFNNIDFSRSTADKNGAIKDVHGSLHDISRTEEAASHCQGSPPILPIGFSIVLASPPEVPTYPTLNEVSQINQENMPIIVACIQAIAKEYPDEPQDSALYSRIFFDTYKPFGITRSSNSRSVPIPNAAEWAILRKNFSKWPGIFLARADAEAAVVEYFGTDCDSDRGNAFKHAYLNIRLCIEVGEDLAEQMANAHEDFPGNSEDTKAMDLHNNLIGRQIFREKIKNNPNLYIYKDSAEILLIYINRYPTALVSYPDIPDIPNLVCLKKECNDTIPSRPGEIVVSETSRVNGRGVSGVYLQGTETYWKRKNIGHEGSMLMTMSNGAHVDNEAYWTPDLPVAGNYEIQVFIPANYADTKSARYVVGFRDRQQTVVINQSVYFHQWVSLGVFTCNQGTDTWVYLNDVTGEPFNSRMIGFDAVRFIKI